MANHLGKDLAASATGNKGIGAPAVATHPSHGLDTSGGTKRQMAVQDEDQDTSHDSGEHRGKLKSSSDASEAKMEKDDKPDDDDDDKPALFTTISGHKVYLWYSTSVWDKKWKKMVELGRSINNQKHEVGARIMELDNLMWDSEALWGKRDSSAKAKKKKERLDNMIEKQSGDVEFIKKRKRMNADRLERLIEECVSVGIDDRHF